MWSAAAASAAQDRPRPPASGPCAGSLAPPAAVRRRPGRCTGRQMYHETHPRVAARLRLSLQVVERHPRGVVRWCRSWRSRSARPAASGRAPTPRTGPSRGSRGSHRSRRTRYVLPCAPDDVTGRQDRSCPCRPCGSISFSLTITSRASDRIDRDQLLGQLQIIGGLALIVGEQKAIVAGRAARPGNGRKPARIRSVVFQFFFARPHSTSCSAGRRPDRRCRAHR